MKKIIIFFLVFSLVFLSIPILGVYTQNKLFDKSIFNYSFSLYLLGISSNEHKTVLGSNGWMFLGNDYGNVIDKSQTEYIESQIHVDKSEKIITELSLISVNNNAKFKFMVAPNKHSIYGEHIGLNSSIGDYNYYDNNAMFKRLSLISYFRDQKIKTSKSLYFKTDTHWNDFGAFLGYQFLMDKVLNEDYNKIPNSYEFESVEKNGGDLARLLNINEYILDENFVPIEKVSDLVIRTNLTNNQSSRVSIQGKVNNSTIKDPIKIINKKAKNELKVLWLHDSFGTAMSPYMHITFSEVIHQHYSYAFKNMTSLKKLIKDVKPDIVLFSIVERESLKFGSY